MDQINKIDLKLKSLIKDLATLRKTFQESCNHDFQRDLEYCQRENGLFTYTCHKCGFQK